MFAEETEAEALHEALQTHTVEQQQQQQTGPGRTVHPDHRALLRQETLGQRVVLGRHRRQDEAGVVAVPPAERRDADLDEAVFVKNLAAAVGVATEDEAGLEPLQQPLRSLLGQHVVLLSEQQVALFGRSSILTCAAGVTHSVERVVL